MSLIKVQKLLQEEALPATVVHEFTCRVAETLLLQERAAGREPDPRCWGAVAAKRAWLRSELSDDGLDVACEAAGWVQPKYLGYEWDLAHKAAFAAVWAADRPERTKNPAARLNWAALEAARCAASYFAWHSWGDSWQKAKETSKRAFAVNKDSYLGAFIDQSRFAEAQTAWAKRAAREAAQRAGWAAVYEILSTCIPASARPAP